MNESADYKEMYLKMVRASEDAIRIHVKAQRECEEMYMDSVVKNEVRRFFGPEGAEQWMKDEQEDKAEKKVGR